MRCTGLGVFLRALNLVSLPGRAVADRKMKIGNVGLLLELTGSNAGRTATEVCSAAVNRFFDAAIIGLTASVPVISAYNKRGRKITQLRR